MKKKITLFALIFALVAISYQARSQFMLDGGIDLIKTNISGAFEKVQVGAEFNYFIVNEVSLGAGFELWTARGFAVPLGVRYYPIRPLFLRLRGFVGEFVDVGIGVGYSKAIARNLRLEIMGDYYADQGELALRLGLAVPF